MARLSPWTVGKLPYNMHISEIDTPAIVVDLDIMERNLAVSVNNAR